MTTVAPLEGEASAATPPERRVDPTIAHAHSAMASMLRLSLKPLPRNYQIWFDYHAGDNTLLRRVIDTLISNGQCLDEEQMKLLHMRFGAAQPETDALRETSGRLQDILRQVAGLIGEAEEDASRRGSSLRALSGELASAGPEALAEAMIRLIAEVTEMSEYSADIARRLDASAQRVAALERRLESVLREAHTDALTGLSNRRAFDAALQGMAGAAMNSGMPLAILLLDIDRFKAINDTWGHPVGDAVLCRIAITIRDNLGEEGLAARFGGEEFAVILGGTPLPEAMAVAERLRVAVAAQNYSIRTTGHSLGQITVSAGAAVFKAGEALASLLARADAALYRAKQAGRNRVEASDDGGAIAPAEAPNLVVDRASLLLAK